MDMLSIDKVRVKQELILFLKDKLMQIDPNLEIYLFGSRTDVSKKGGDIDLLILSDYKIDEGLLRKVKADFWRKFGEQKLDIVNFTFAEDVPFKRIALSTALRL